MIRSRRRDSGMSLDRAYAAARAGDGAAAVGTLAAVLGTMDPETAATVAVVVAAAVLFAQLQADAPRGSEAWAQYAVTAASQLYGWRHHTAVRAARVLAGVQWARGEYADVYDTYSLIAAARIDARLDDACCALAQADSAQRHTGHPELAVQALRPVLARLDPDRSPANVSLRFTALGYASAAACTAPPPQAAAGARYAYDMSTRSSGEHDDATTLEAAPAWAPLLTSRRVHRDAHALYEQILAGREATGCAGDVFLARADLALSMHRLGRCGQAIHDLAAGWTRWAAGGCHQLRAEVGLRWAAVLVACDLPADARTVLAGIAASYPPPGSPARATLRQHAATLIAATMTGHDQVCAGHDDIPDLDLVEKPPADTMAGADAVTYHPPGSAPDDPHGDAHTHPAPSTGTIPAWYNGSPPIARSGRHELDALLAWLLAQPTRAPSEGARLVHHVDAMRWLTGTPSTAVARILLTRGEWLICKTTTEPGIGEAGLLDYLADAGLPVPEVAATGRAGPRHGMLTRDLGPAVRAATLPEQARTLAAIHRVRPAPYLPRIDGFHLAGTPGRALNVLQRLSGTDGWPDSTVLSTGLRLLDLIGEVRAADAHTPPYGLCHRTTTADALLATASGVHLVGWRHACVGPGLLDLAARITAPDDERDPDRDAHAFATLTEAYHAAGGNHRADQRRGGLPAHRWALGWHAALRTETVLLAAAAPPTHRDHIDPASLHRQATAWLALALDNLT